ncbi:MAG: hypothetical protein WCF60_06175 [Anaerobacillus sp.]
MNQVSKSLKGVNLSSSKKFLIRLVMLMLLLSIELTLLPDHVIMQVVAISVTIVIVEIVMNQLNPSNKKTN